MTDEEWKPVPNFEGLYEISNLGRVRSLGRISPHGQTRQRMAARVNQTAASDDPVMRHIQPHILRESTNRGYRVVYISPPGERTKNRKLYIDRLLKELWPQRIESEFAIRRRANGLREPVPNLPNEEWRDIVGYEGLYQISNFGRVKSLERVIYGQKSRYVRERIRAPNALPGRYPKADLAKDGKTFAIGIHRLVAQAFVPNPLRLDCVHHKDEDKTNCRADNLEWTTRADNVRDWFKRRGGDAVKRVAAALGISEAEARKIILGDSDHS